MLPVLSILFSLLPFPIFPPESIAAFYPGVLSFSVNAAMESRRSICHKPFHYLLHGVRFASPPSASLRYLHIHLYSAYNKCETCTAKRIRRGDDDTDTDHTMTPNFEGVPTLVIPSLPPPHRYAFADT